MSIKCATNRVSDVVENPHPCSGHSNVILSAVIRTLSLRPSEAAHEILATTASPALSFCNGAPAGHSRYGAAGFLARSISLGHQRCVSRVSLTHLQRN